MFQLSEQQTDMIYERLQCEGLKSTRLEQDLFDHFCCYIEAQMKQGADIESAYRSAVEAISPNGAKEIEFELFFIMNFNKQLTMKKFIFLTGFLATFLLSTGIMFKTLHWFASNILLFTGFAMLLITMAALAIHAGSFLRNQSTAFWLRTVTGIASLALIALGFIFRILQMPGANIMYGLGTIIMNFIFLPVFFYQIYKYGFVKTDTNETV